MDNFIIEGLKFIVAIYDKTTPSIRFAYIFWVLFIELYIFASALEKHNDLLKPRELKKRNYHGTLYLFGGLAIMMQHGSQMYNWPFLSPISTGNGAYWLSIFGLIFMAKGLYLVGAARCVLNGHWGPHIYKYPQPEHNILKSSGIFQYTRHPVFFGQMLMTGGTFLLSNNWWIILFPISTIVLNIWRARREEDDLEQRFGQAFFTYRNTTSFLVPYI